jgi:hypothetical protein
MSKFEEIFEGWKNRLFKNQTIEEEANKRAAICFLCPYNKNNKCGKCGCNLSAKIRSPKSKCPENKW